MSDRATGTGRAPLLDRETVRRLFDLRASANALTGGGCTDDPYPAARTPRRGASARRRAARAHRTLRRLVLPGLPFPDRPHFTAFSFAACDGAFRDPDTFASAPIDDAVGPGVGGGGVGVQSSMLSMGGAQHRRYRALVQPSFVPAKARWWVDHWIAHTVHSLIDGFAADGR